MWTLILTIVIGSATSINSVHGFSTESVCKNAADLWMADTKLRSLGSYSVQSAICVKSA